MNIYYIRVLENEWTSLVTAKLSEYLIDRSDCFSFTYYVDMQYPPTEQCRIIRNFLKDIAFACKKTNIWPGNNVVCQNKQTYYEVEYYKLRGNSAASEIDSKSIARKAMKFVNRFSDWNHPNRPMDLCLYRNGMCWFYVVAHENIVALYPDENATVDYLLHFSNELHKRYNIPESIIIPDPVLLDIADDPDCLFSYPLPEEIREALDD